MAASSLSLAVLFLFLVVLVASAAVPATAGGEYSGATMVIMRGPAATRVGGASGGGARSNDKWRQHYRRLVEDEVAPEFGGLLGAGDGHVDYNALKPNGPACPSGNQPCAAKNPGQPYTRGCTYESRCPHTPAGIAN